MTDPGLLFLLALFSLLISVLIASVLLVLLVLAVSAARSVGWPRWAPFHGRSGARQQRVIQRVWRHRPRLTAPDHPAPPRPSWWRRFFLSE